MGIKIDLFSKKTIKKHFVQKIYMGNDTIKTD